MAIESTNEAARSEGVLYGMAAIASYLRIRPRQGYHLVDRGGLPTFKLGGTVCARPSTLDAWLAEREAAAIAAHH